MTGYGGTGTSVLENVDDLAQFCKELFSHIPRSDQRRWAEVYTRGLISVPGRKSIRRIADYMVGWRADQCLQQFVNQSPWQWQPVRRSLAHQLGAGLRPRAWLVEEVVFPKNGDRSVGVCKQYSTSAQRMLNCQLGLAVMLAGDDAACAVNWRLMLPQSWDADEVRRGRAHVPDHERHAPRGQQVLAAIDELLDGWDLPPAPVVVDAEQDPDTEPLLQGLEERGLRYLVRVGERTPALPATPRTPADARRAPTVGELVALSARQGRMTVNWRDRVDGTSTTSRFSATAVPGGPPLGAPVRLDPRRPYRPARGVLAEWSLGGGRPTALWINNLGSARLPDLIALTKLRSRVTGEMTRMREEFGLQSFEGRSFRGWHHHVTLVSAAHVYRTLRRLEAERADETVQLRPRA
ncbi:SRSO17 transposase [Actinokineospora auranticolor]|uniref:SRSO17 transposase n=1 Tax=Actinokineospora auranticolor TaxID=155976 RepID=A0A2S6GJQ5_9PSEU|nr:SRSO17 transposase [Actinokineospora auranticolor]